jgi:hypothetical protein
LAEGAGARLRVLCSMKSWVQCSRVKEEGWREKDGVEDGIGGSREGIGSSIGVV